MANSVLHETYFCHWFFCCHLVFWFNLGKVVGRTFDITEYGICFLEDLVGELPDSSFTVCIFNYYFKLCFSRVLEQRGGGTLTFRVKKHYKQKEVVKRVRGTLILFQWSYLPPSWKISQILHKSHYWSH